MSRPPLLFGSPWRERIAAWALAAQPAEACGLLLGSRGAQGIQVREATCARNLELLSPATRFFLHPADQLAAERRATALGLEVVGVWHSHPDRPARPSAADRAGAEEGRSHLIVEVRAEGIGALRAYLCRGGELLPQPIHGPAAQPVE
jgi:proteasome lid subunit RPN8/RPN11